MLLAVRDSNECDFGIEFFDESKLELVEKLASAGLGAWYQSASDDMKNEYFTEEEIESFYNDGYAEPTSELLDRYDIKYRIVDLEYDAHGNCICDEELWLG